MKLDNLISIVLIIVIFSGLLSFVFGENTFETNKTDPEIDYDNAFTPPDTATQREPYCSSIINPNHNVKATYKSPNPVEKFIEAKFVITFPQTYSNRTIRFSNIVHVQSVDGATKISDSKYKVKDGREEVTFFITQTVDTYSSSKIKDKEVSVGHQEMGSFIREEWAFIPVPRIIFESENECTSSISDGVSFNVKHDSMAIIRAKNSIYMSSNSIKKVLSQPSQAATTGPDSQGSSTKITVIGDSKNINQKFLRRITYHQNFFTKQTLSSPILFVLPPTATNGGGTVRDTSIENGYRSVGWINSAAGSETTYHQMTHLNQNYDVNSNDAYWFIESSAIYISYLGVSNSSQIIWTGQPEVVLYSTIKPGRKFVDDTDSVLTDQDTWEDGGAFYKGSRLLFKIDQQIISNTESRSLLSITKQFTGETISNEKIKENFYQSVDNELVNRMDEEEEIPISEDATFPRNGTELSKNPPKSYKIIKNKEIIDPPN